MVFIQNGTAISLHLYAIAPYLTTVFVFFLHFSFLDLHASYFLKNYVFVLERNKTLSMVSP